MRGDSQGHQVATWPELQAVPIREGQSGELGEPRGALWGERQPHLCFFFLTIWREKKGSC